MALPISYGVSKAARLASAQEFLPSGFGASTAAVSGRSSAASSTAKYYNQLSDQISKITAQNNAWSAAQAAQQMAFQRESAQTAMAFNREEAQKNRDWQQYMSDTAHQREIKDLQAAGLNPVLSAMGGNGAPLLLVLLRQAILRLVLWVRQILLLLVLWLIFLVLSFSLKPS